MGKPAEDTAPRRAARLATALLVVAALYLARELFIPLFVATLLGFLLVPIVRVFERRLGRMAAVALVVGLALGCVAGVGGIVVAQAASLAAEIPKYRHNLASKIGSLRSSTADEVDRASRAVEEISDVLRTPESAPATQPVPGNGAVPAEGATTQADAERGDTGAHPAMDPPAQPDAANDGGNAATANATDAAAAEESEPVKVEVVSSKSEMLRWMGGLVAPVLHPLATAGVTLVFVIFFLIYREDLRDRFLRICGQAHINVTTAALTEAAARVTRYLSSLALVNAFAGVGIAIGLFLIGVPNAVLWGLLAGLLRFMPFVGPWLAALFPLAVSVALLESWTQPLLVALWFILFEAVCVNLIEPWFYGARMGVSPVAALLSLVFWTWLWGAVGLVMAMPITACLVVAGRFIPAFEIFYILLGNEPVLKPAARLYQRLLAMDRHEALKVARHAVQKNSFADGCDKVVLPALAQIERDQRDDLLDGRRVEFVKGVLGELLETEKPSPVEPSAAQPAGTSRVVLVPVDGAFARSAADLLAPALRPAAGAEAASNGVAVRDMAGALRERTAQAAVLIAVEPRTARRLAEAHEDLSRALPQADVFLLVLEATPLDARRKRLLARLPAHVQMVRSARELQAALQT